MDSGGGSSGNYLCFVLFLPPPKLIKPDVLFLLFHNKLRVGSAWQGDWGKFRGVYIDKRVSLTLFESEVTRHGYLTCCLFCFLSNPELGVDRRR